MSHCLRPGLPPLPKRIAKLPLDERGYPVPWFVGTVNGKYDFRVADARKMIAAVEKKLCWVCGEPLGKYKTFVIGPMCGINRVSSEPPQHHECAMFSVRACPFLLMPKMDRRDHDYPEGSTEGAGVMIKRNPGVSLVWTTKTFTVNQFANGLLFTVGDAESVEFIREGRTATRAEILESIKTGLPLLIKAAEPDGPEGVALLNKMAKEFIQLIPLDHVEASL